MNSHDLFDMIGDARGEYIWDAQQARLGMANTQRKRPSSRSVLLIAAVITLSLLLVGCAVAYVQGWFAEYFTTKGEQPLSDSQIAFLEENEQQISSAKTINGWTLELGSVISDGIRGYILIGITAPEGTNLDTVMKNGVNMSHVKVGNGMLHSHSPILKIPGGVSSSYSYIIQEDEDGLPHTTDLVLQLSPDLKKCSIDPFGKEAVYQISVEDIYRETVNEEVWDGISQIFTFDEAWTDELLADGLWEFSFTFGLDEKKLVQRELVTTPFTTTALYYYQYGENEFDDAGWFTGEHTITSFVLTPLTAIITYEPMAGQDARSEFAWGYDAACYAVMEDGREIRLRRTFGGEEYTSLLQVAAPLVLEEVDHIRMADGTKIFMDGTVEQPRWKAEPSTNPPETLIPGVSTSAEIAAYYDAIPAEVGVYAYCNDFDGDGIFDAAIWKDDRYIALCCLTADGLLKEWFPFEPALTLKEVATQYGGEAAEMLAASQILVPVREFYRY